MRIHLISVGGRMPAWVDDGYAEYARRMPPECRLELHPVNARRRGKNADLERIRRDEGRRMLAAVPRGARVIALEPAGREWSTEDLAARLGDWLLDGRDLALLVGGPEGLSGECRQAAEQRWSLSRLTFPHPLVRVIVAEQLYRAWSLHAGHPYHR